MKAMPNNENSFGDAHHLEISQVLSHLDTNLETGLTTPQVKTNLERYGKNILPQSKKSSALAILINQFKSTVVFILVLAAVISFAYDHFLDGYIIVAIILVNAIVGFVQEFQAERSIEALKELVVPRTRVRRDGKIIVLSSQDIVPGDIILCTEGDSVPADARLIQVTNLQTDESSLTGESLPIAKDIDALPPSTPLAERTNMLWMGTQVVAGECEALVVSTGKQTILGKIAQDLSKVEESADHFKIKTNQLGRQMGFIALFSTFAIAVVGVFVRGFGFQEMFMFSVASLVSALPEGLPVILTVILALSAKRMASKKAIVRRLSATETLAVVDTIITDKTGTLTQNLMTVTAIKFPYQPHIEVTHQGSTLSFSQDSQTPTVEHFPLQKLLDITGSCHNVKREYDGQGTEHFSGDPTEVALVTLADKAISSPSYYQRKIHQIQDLPFNQEHRWRASVVEYLDSGNTEVFVIGSPETVLAKCTQILLPDHQSHAFDQDRKHHINEHIEELTSQGMRVLAITFRSQESRNEIKHEEIHGLTFVGLVGLIDPPHPETRGAILKAHQAGIQVIMATGDHPLTAKTIGLTLGLIEQGSVSATVLTENDIVELSDQELSDKLDQVRIFARMSPSSKLRLATLLQKKGKVVAMTGDGVNDAPALKQADIGIGMGKKGTDVAREASDIVLADDNFATIILAIEEGRTQLRNVRRTSFFYVTTNIAESVTLVLFLCIGLPLPLLPKQILWLNLVTGGFTALALATEPIHKGVLESKPSKINEAILNKKNIPFLAAITLTIVALATVFFLIYQPQGIVKARTMLFIVLSLSQIFNLFNMRSLRESIFRVGLFTSRNINLAIIVSLLLMLAVLYLPAVTSAFEFTSVSALDMMVCILASLLVVVVGEGYKKLIIRAPAQESTTQSVGGLKPTLH